MSAMREELEEIRYKLLDNEMNKKMPNYEALIKERLSQTLDTRIITYFYLFLFIAALISQRLNYESCEDGSGFEFEFGTSPCEERIESNRTVSISQF